MIYDQPSRCDFGGVSPRRFVCGSSCINVPHGAADLLLPSPHRGIMSPVVSTKSLLGGIAACLLIATSSLAQAPTPTPIGCIGDCNGDGQVTVDEIVTSVNVALSGSTTTCPAFDCCPGCDGGQGGTLVDCLITTVNNALNGCLVWRPGCSPPFPVVGGGNPRPPSVTICTTDQVLGRSCDAPGASCCPSDSLCTGGFCNAGLVCDIRPPTRCPVLREVESP